MEQNIYAPDYNQLPQSLAVFPLHGALLLPMGQLPLNIFEPRYIAMIDDAMASGRMIGIIQPRDESDTPDLLKTGCAGKIVEFSETNDGRYLINLSGTYRFDIKEELSPHKPYRVVTPDWFEYRADHTAHECLDLNRKKLKTLLKNYFEHQGIDCDWEAVDNAPDGRLITCLSMICPFEPREKQALLEAPCCKTRADTFMSMLEIAAGASVNVVSKHRH